MAIRKKLLNRPKPAWVLDPSKKADQQTFDWAAEKARVEFKRFQKFNDDCWTARPGERLPEATFKWLIREMLLTDDDQAKWRAAGQYREVVYAINSIAKNRTNSKKSRPRGDTKHIEAALRRRPDGTYKEIAGDMESAGHEVIWRGFADRVSRAKKKLRAEQSEIDKVAGRRGRAKLLSRKSH